MITIKIQNNDDQTLDLFIEPEGSLFNLPPKEEVLIKVEKDGDTVIIKSEKSESGTKTLSIWPDKGSFEVEYKGRDIYEFLV
jgi:bifunctional DNA-binding transcriptional regulator/antitoxin component of YhaV-PrlF toxin-antitoxin module